MAKVKARKIKTQTKTKTKIKTKTRIKENTKVKIRTMRMTTTRMRTRTTGNKARACAKTNGSQAHAPLHGPELMSIAPRKLLGVRVSLRAKSIPARGK